MYYWYKNSRLSYSTGQRKGIKNAQMEDGGFYQCAYGGSATKSDPVYLDISFDWLILQANYVYEGDTLFLKCHGWNSKFKNVARFFKDGKFLLFTEPILQKEKITTEATGRYRCERERWNVILYTKETAETFVTVYELFSQPTLTLIESPLMEGDGMTLKCDTSLALPRNTTKLQFAIYRNGQNVREFGASDTYKVTSAQLGDSGNYNCEVRTVSDTVRKNSKTIFIQIRAIFSEPTLSVNQPHLTEGDVMNLKCDTTLVPPNKNTELRFAFYKDERTVREFGVSDTYRSPSARVEDSGNYACEVKTANGAVKKRSKNSLFRIKTAFGQTQMKLSADEVVVGDNIIISCESTMSTLPICYTFYHNDTSFSNITVHQKEAAVERVAIKSPSMAGLYFCISDNGIAKQKQLSNMVLLLVVEPVSGVYIGLDKAGEDFVHGDLLTLKCSLKGGSYPTFLWIHNGKVVKNSRVYQLKEDGKVLYIHSLRFQHSGSYQCSVSNKVSNRTFSVISDIQNINVLPQSPVKESTFTVDDEEDPPEQNNILWTLLGVLVLVVALCVVLIIYRHKVSSIVPWFQQQTNPDPTFAKARPRVGHNVTQEVAPRPGSKNNLEEDYTNVPNMAQNVDGDVYYSHIQMLGPTDNSREQEEYSVTYSAVKCSGTKMDKTQTLDPAQLYENFSSKESEDRSKMNLPHGKNGIRS